MRTKTLLLTAAVLAAGLGASVAQSVFSVNAVGDVNLTLGQNYSLICNPLNGTNNNLSTILPTPPDGTYVLRWLPAQQTFSDPYTYIDGLGWLPDTTVAPGEGIFINLPGPGNATLTFVGDVPQGNSISNHLFGNYSLVSQIVPQQIALDNPSVGLPVQDGDYVLFWDAVHQTFGDPISYIDGLGWLPSAPTPAVGQGFFYNTSPSAGRAWTRSFSVN